MGGEDEKRVLGDDVERGARALRVSRWRVLSMNGARERGQSSRSRC